MSFPLYLFYRLNECILLTNDMKILIRTAFDLAFVDNGFMVNVLPDANRTESFSADQATEYTGPP
jgi:hypothetical protein